MLELLKKFSSVGFPFFRYGLPDKYFPGKGIQSGEHANGLCFYLVLIGQLISIQNCQIGDDFL